MAEFPESGKIKDAANAVKGLLDAFPVYKDVFQPSAQTIGGELQKAVHAGLMPLRLLVWGAEELEAYLTRRLAEKLEGVPIERIKTPDPIVAGPAIEALRFAGGNEVLREMFATLLATSMDSVTATSAHPGFVEILKNLVPDEAKIVHFLAKDVAIAHPVVDLLGMLPRRTEYCLYVRNFSLLGSKADCVLPDATPAYLDNLVRLGLVEIPETEIVESGIYTPLENSPDLADYIETIEKTDGRKHSFQRKCIGLTNLGREFCYSCVLDHSVCAERLASQ
ncbi:MAG: DUF4393 domain-containing protein [bacterium]|nr:DUF4393 domain-containing protein [bacterium]